jgi:HEAT repeat protein
LVGIFTTDSRLIIQFWDAYLEQLTRIRADDARGKRLQDVFPQFEQRGLLEPFERVLELGVVEVLSTPLHQDSMHAETDQKQKQLVSIGPLRSHTSIVGVITTIEDVSRRGGPEIHGSDSQIQGAIAMLMRTLRMAHRDASVLNGVLQILTSAGWPTFEPLHDLLQEEDAQLRTYAALALGELRDPRAVPSLIQALGDADTNVRYHAIEALGRLQAVDAVDPLLAVAETTDFFLAFPALDALVEIGDPRAASRLVPLLEDVALRPAVLEALGRLGDATVVGAVLGELPRSPELAPTIAEALVNLEHRYTESYGEAEYIVEKVRSSIRSEAARHMLTALNSTHGPALRALVRVLGWSGGREVAESLTRMLGSTDVRGEVVETLVRYGASVTDLLCSQLHSADEGIRRAAITALARIGDTKAAPELIRLLAKDEALTIPIAGALAKIGDPRAYDALIDLLSHSSSAVRQAAIAALNSLGHPQLSHDAARLIDDANPQVRESAVKIIGYFGYVDCVEALLRSTADDDETVRRAAVESLAFAPDDRALEILRRTIREDVPRVRAAAVHALSYFEAALVLSDLLPALQEGDPWVRYYAARALGQLHAVEALDSLVSTLRQESVPFVRIAVADALGDIGGSKAAAALAPLLETEDLDLVRSAALALGKLGHPDAAAPLVAMLRSADPERRRDALRALALRRDAEAVDNLQWTALTDKEPLVAAVAVDELVSMKTEAAVIALVRLTAQKSIREAVVSALSRLDPAFINVVAAGLDNPQLEVRRAVTEALGRHRHPDATDFLVRALSDEQPPVRLAAVLALGRLGSRAAQKSLAAAAHGDADESVRRAARKVLERLA